MFYNTLENYYRTNFSLMQHHKYSLTEIEGMMPWERTVYVSLLNQWIKEQEEKIKAQQNA
ncbi:baseplate hub assembly catalyst [Cyanophage S-RIM32]|uniref:Baseplate hub assembly catalyst n=1 Tax=Cyanophage S-RIM32 TaxID=1278479 RepID=A0A127KLR1_9CAUD|nr:baseplate hub assembly catalyst [Cyanophage S-RIM32]AMO43024.1 baseplate hub assembly catalyst [Cyanophage S-RIM32]